MTGLQLRPVPPARTMDVEMTHSGAMFDEIRRLERDLDMPAADLNWSTAVEHERYLRELRMANAGEHS